MDFNPQFNFDNFVVGPSNRFAHSAAIAVSKTPGQVYNPLFIYGPPGVGKTHLLYAIANGIRKTNPDANIVYIKGDQFTIELIEAIKNGKNIEFRNKYREADLFLIDDIQFIAGKESTQEEFFHTFNKLYEEHKQIVMTSDRKPSDMLTLEDRLKSRFEWGLLADIQPPDYETRMAILKNKAKSLGLQLNDDVCNYIAINVTNNVRQIEGTVKKILAYRDLNDMPLDLPNISRAIDDMFKVEGNALPTPSLIISQVCKFYSIDEPVLRGSQKSKGIAEPRQMAMYLIRKLTNLSFPDIGKEFGKDHSTVLYNVRKVEMELKKGDTTLQNNIRDITANINSCL
jgi:chromosomal replication initiator protein